MGALTTKEMTTEIQSLREAQVASFNNRLTIS